MSRKVTKAVNNRYCQARLKAAEYNADFSIRRTAAEYLPGVEEDSLKKYELDITRPPNTVVALMADAYNAPDLKEWYCATECPLGKECRVIDDMPAERTLIRLHNSSRELRKVIEDLSFVMQDGKISENEEATVMEAKEILLENKRRITEILAALSKAEKTGKF